MTNAVVLGGTGMLGAMVVDVFSSRPDLKVIATRRSDVASLDRMPIAWTHFDALSASVDDCRQICAGATWIVNCIGITKPLIADDDPTTVERAIRINALFPHILATAAAAEGTKILQIATDCVYSGLAGNYTEASPHDALDVYGKTKSLGEISSPAMHHLRASIVGPEPKEHKFLLDWFLGQPQTAVVNGFTNHEWNGVTTLHFARVALGIVCANIALPHVHHLLPSGRISKAAMLEAFRRSYRREDIRINQVEAGSTVDRTLTTSNDVLNGTLWSAAGYSNPPTIELMIEELAAHKVEFGHSTVAA